MTEATATPAPAPNTEPNTELNTGPKPASDPLARGVLLPGRALSKPRAVVALGGALAALVAIVIGHSDLGAFGWIEVGLLGLAGGAMLLDRVDAHVFVRSVLWGVLCYGAIDVLDHSHEWSTFASQARAYTVLLGTGASLLALGRAGLDGEHGAFFPIVMRRSLLTMMVVGLCVAHVMAVLAVAAADQSWSLMATALVTPALLVLAVIGLSRTRSWGLFAYLGTLPAAAGSVALYLNPPSLWLSAAEFVTPTTFLAIAWSFFGVVLFLAGLPVLFAVALKPRPRPTGKGWGQYVHAALVLAAVGLTLYGALLA